MNHNELDSLFHPKSIAIVGASAEPRGMIFLSNIVQNGFRGKLYPVSPRGGEVLGFKIYTSIKDIPGQVDYAFLQVPAQAAIEVLKDCGAKGVKLATLFTAGFGESEAKGGSELEQELLRAARQSGVRLLGPNCLGLYCPAVGIAFGSNFPRESGPVGVLCQSGGHAGQLVYAAAERGIRFSKVISYGNALDLNEAELMEYFAQDPDTRVIIAYIERVREGKRFFQALRTAAQAKPVIVYKGGQSEVGAAATLCHTGSMAGSVEVWDGLLKQAGAIRASTVDECIDIALALLYMKPPASRKTAAIGLGGGVTVQAADECFHSGLILPALPNDIRDELKKFTPVAGNIFRNPVDISGNTLNPPEIGHGIRVIGNWNNVDLLIVHLGFEVGPGAPPQLMEHAVAEMIKAVKEVGKPAALAAYAAYSPQACQSAFEVQRMCSEAEIPLFPSIQRAASAIDKLIKRHQAL